MAADKKYLVLHRNNLTIAIQMQLSQKQKNFRNFLLHFQNLDSILTILKKKMTLTPFLFPKLRSPKTWLEKCLKGSVLENPSASNMVNMPKQFWNQYHSTLTIFIDHYQRQLSLKKSLLLTRKTLGLLLNTLAADEKYLVLHRDNLTIPIQMQLSPKQKTFS